MKHNKMVILLFHFVLMLFLLCPFSVSAATYNDFTRIIEVNNWHDYFTLTDGDFIGTVYGEYQGESVSCSVEDYNDSNCTFDVGSTVSFEMTVPGSFFEDYDGDDIINVNFLSVSPKYSFIESYAHFLFKNMQNPDLQLNCTDYVDDDPDNIGIICEEYEVSTVEQDNPFIDIPPINVNLHFGIRGNMADSNGYFQMNKDASYCSADCLETLSSDSVKYYDNINYYDLDNIATDVENSSYNVSYLPDLTYSKQLYFDDQSILLGTASNEVYNFLADEDNPGDFSVDIDLYAVMEFNMADTGLFYDLLPFIILIGSLVLGFIFIKKNKIKSHSLEEE